MCSIILFFLYIARFSYLNYAHPQRVYDTGTMPHGGLESKIRSNPLAVILCLFVLGIVFDRSLPQPALAWAAGSLLGLALRRLSSTRITVTLSLAAAIVCLGGLRHHVHWHLFAPNNLGRFATDLPRPVHVEVRALSRPKTVPAPPANPLTTMPRGDHSRLEVAAIGLGVAGRWKSVSGRGMLRVEGHLLNVVPGDRLKVTGKLVKPARSMNPGQFDFANYERSHRRTYGLLCGSPDCVIVRQVEHRGFRRWIDQVRSAANDQLWGNLSPQRHELAAAILLGARGQLSSDRIESFFETGTIHLLAVSGLHVGILASGLMWLARTALLPSRWSFLMVMVLAIAYAILAEARAPVIRATILVCVACLGWMLRRQASATNSIAAAALVVLVVNPCELFRAGAQLSFVAVATLARIAALSSSKSSQEDPLDKLIRTTRPLPVRIFRTMLIAICRALCASVIVWSVTLPLVMYHFHIVCPVAIILNVVLWVPISLALLFGFATIVIGWLLPPTAFWFGKCCDLHLWVLESVVQAVRPIPGTRFWCAGQEGAWVIGFYFVLALYCMFTPHRFGRAVRLIIVLTCLVSGWLFPQGQLEKRTEQPDLVRCTFLCVGHGTSVVLEPPGGQCIIYDAGCLGSHEYGASVVSGFLWSRGIRRIDRIVLSHADADHYNAVPILLERFRVDEILVPVMFFDKSSDAIDELLKSIEMATVRITRIESGYEFANMGNARISVLHPRARRVGNSDNANSVVLRIQYAGRNILLPGDVEGEGLDMLLSQPTPPCSVVMAPHHGSMNSEPTRFVDWSEPNVVVISGRRRHATSEEMKHFRSRESDVYHTAIHGAVTIAWAPGGAMLVDGHVSP